MVTIVSKVNQANPGSKTNNVQRGSRRSRRVRTRSRVPLLQSFPSTTRHADPGRCGHAVPAHGDHGGGVVVLQESQVPFGQSHGRIYSPQSRRAADPQRARPGRGRRYCSVRPSILAWSAGRGGGRRCGGDVAAPGGRPGPSPSGAAAFPWDTLLVNLVGSLLLGFIVVTAFERLAPSRYFRPLIGTGFCGGLTTFSTFAVEIVLLIRAGRVGVAVALSRRCRWSRGSALARGGMLLAHAVWNAEAEVDGTLRTGPAPHHLHRRAGPRRTPFAGLRDRATRPRRPAWPG